MIAKKLIIFSNGEYYVDQNGREYLWTGIENQLVKLAEEFNEVILYGYPTKGKNIGADVTEAGFKFRPIGKKAPTSITEFLINIFAYTKVIKRMLRESKKKDIFLVLLPGSLLNIYAGYWIKFYRKDRVFFRVGSNIAKQFGVGSSSRIRKLINYIAEPILNFLMTNLVKGVLTFYTGYLMYGEKNNHYKMRSISLNEKDIYHRKDTCKNQPYKLLYVGRVEYSKGLSYLLQALTNLRKQHDLKLIVVGDGPELENLKELARELRIKDNVVFKGHVPFGEKLFKEYKQADIFVLPTLDDAQAKTPLESMAFGTPVIATRVGGIPTVVKNKKNGLLVESKNTNELTKAINKIIEDDDLRKNLIKQGYKTTGEYTIKNQMRFLIGKIKDYFKA